MIVHIAQVRKAERGWTAADRNRHEFHLISVRRRHDQRARVTCMKIMPASAAYQFPHGFLWGAATSSHQVEGNNRWNDWWEMEQAHRLPHASGSACEHFERFESDFDLARS